MERYDAVVVGAGPAGSTTAFRLASAGARTLLVDRQRFPRDKPCGGGLTWRAVRLLPFSVEPVVEDTVVTMRLGLGYRRGFDRTSREPVILMTQRKRLDHFLVQQAQEAGAELREGAKAADLVLHDDRVTLTVDGEPVEAAALVGADGCNGTVARTLGLGRDYTHGVALEGNVPYTPDEETRLRGRAVVELGTVPGGYGWVFPKGDHFNVGVGGWESEGPRLREHLRRLCEAYEVDPARVEETRGYRLPLRRPSSPLMRGRALLVGDAAGLVDPLTGDGMYEAILSGKAAAEAIGDLLAGRAADLEPYGQTVTRKLAPLLSAAWGAKLAFDRYPRLAYSLARPPLVWKVVEGIMRGDLAHPGATRGLARGPLKAIEALARLQGNPGQAYKLEATA